jgi:hypothetical protein
MPAAAAEPFRAWHDFYLLLGTASATLIGATFIVASIGNRFMTEDRLPQIGAFITSTVVHLSAVVMISALVTVPALDQRSLGVMFGLAGLAGIAYCVAAAWHVLRARVHWSDPLWYCLMPTVAYAAMAAAALSMLLNEEAGIGALAIAPALLLITGIRNAWDMIIYFATRDDSHG